MSHPWLSCSLALALTTSIGCKSEGSFSGDLSKSQQPSAKSESKAEPAKADSANRAAPPAKHERVAFHWESTDESRSGRLHTTLPDGETFSGEFHEITDSTTVQALSGFHHLWYADPWGGPNWAWDGGWRYYEPDEFIRIYTGRVVAVLTSDKGNGMRCDFHLDHPEDGMKGGGQGECQVSSGERITAVFSAT